MCAFAIHGHLYKFLTPGIAKIILGVCFLLLCFKTIVKNIIITEDVFTKIAFYDAPTVK